MKSYVLGYVQALTDVNISNSKWFYMIVYETL